MNWTTIKRIFNIGFVNFWRNRVAAAASVVVLTVTLFSVGSLILAQAFLQSSLEELRSRVDISVTFNPEVSESVALNFKKDLEGLAEVKEIKYLSREEELEAFKERHDGNTVLLQSLDEVGNPFGARLNVRAVDPGQYESVYKFIQNKETEAGSTLIDQVTFKRDVVSQLTKIINTINRIGLAVSILLVFMSVLVTFNTISLAIYLARDEISVMRLIGAGDSYVRGPFVVEGILSGLISSVFALGLLYPSVVWLQRTTTGVFGTINFTSYYFSNFIQLVSVLISAGVLLGAISSYLATRKYGKV